MLFFVGIQTAFQKYRKVRHRKHQTILIVVIDQSFITELEILWNMKKGVT